MKKSFLSKFKTPSPLETERKLLPRLKFMGYVLYGWCVWAVGFAVIDVGEAASYENLSVSHKSELFGEEEEELPEFRPKDVLNFYVVGAIFAVVGTACFVIERKKRKTLVH